MSYPKKLETKAICKKILFNNGSFYIAVFSQSKEPFEFTLKGNGRFIEGQEYQIIAELDEKQNKKYLNTYILSSSNRKVETHEIKKSGLLNFLKTITGESKANAMFEMYGDKIVDILENKQKDLLTKVDGIGEIVADKIIKSYQSKEDLSLAIVELSKYNFSENLIKKIIKHYHGNVDLAIEEINENPYIITKVPGVGFKTADAGYIYYYRETPSMLKDKRRVLAYFEYLFRELYDSGSTWITVADFVGKVKEYIPLIDNNLIAEYYKSDPSFSKIKYKNQFRLTTTRNIKLELNIASMLKEMLSKKVPKLNDINSTILSIEKIQKWKFDESQLNAINSALKNSVFLLQGTAGTGKTATIKALYKIFEKNNLTIAQVSLSGKAADNIRKSTGAMATTIHSLLGIMTDNPKNNSNQLEYDVVIVDEISMVDAYLFYKLLSAMKPNSRLIMVGDNGQLDSIGVGVMQGIIDSGIIPTVTLDKIHRQALDSAIITHSLAFRNGKVAYGLNTKPDTDLIYGTKKDLNYVLVKNSEEEKILIKTLEKYKYFYEKGEMMDTQILCATKSTGKVSVDKLNEIAQIISNPYSPDLNEITINDKYTLREGDKVINRLNSKSFVNQDGRETPIFNGNTGVILSINECIVIKFDGIGVVNIPLRNANQIELGYAITIHSSQGSTIKNVIVALPFHYLLNSKELVYTALTRAANNAVIVTSPRALSHALNKTSKKINKTNLEIMLKEDGINEFIL